MKKRLLAPILFAALGCIGHSQSLNIYTEIDPPNQYLDVNGKPTGFMIELVQEIQKRIGNTDRIQFVPWVRAYKELQSTPNTVLFSVARSSERCPRFQWVGPTGEFTFAFFVRTDSKITLNSLDDARKLRSIGVYKDDARDQLLTKAGFTNLDRSIDQITVLKKLMDGRVEAIVGMTEEGMDKLAQSAEIRPEEIKEICAFQKIQSYIAFSKETNSTIVRTWATTLEAMKKDTTFERLYRNYYFNRPLPGPEAKPF
jgi:polar amino acid transport system substrate-binding protein